jgi:hypothetical protein
MLVVGLLKLARPKQWIKNAFVLAPLIFAREFTDPGSVANALIACVLFCVASSAGYILTSNATVAILPSSIPGRSPPARCPCGRRSAC